MNNNLVNKIHRLSTYKSIDFDNLVKKSDVLNLIKNHQENSIQDDYPIYVVLFVSRNKDNRHISDFKSRKISFIVNYIDDSIITKFENFTNQGLTGEMCRCYISVNPRSNKKTQKELIKLMIDQEIDLSKIEAKIASIASQPQNKYNSKDYSWLFDFDKLENQSDIDNEFQLEVFVNEIISKFQDKNDLKIKTYKSPNGYSVIVNKKFDTRELLTKWSNVELKRDDFINHHWLVKST